MNEQQFLKDLEKAIRVRKEINLKMDSRLDQMGSWDSLTMMTVFDMLDEKYKVLVSADDLKACETVADVFKLVVTLR